MFSIFSYNHYNPEQYSLPSAQSVRQSQAQASSLATKEYRKPGYNPYRDGTPGLGQQIDFSMKMTKEVHAKLDASEQDRKCLEQFKEAATHYHKRYEIGDQLFVKQSDPDIRIGKSDFQCKEISAGLVEAFQKSGYTVKTDSSTSTISIK